MSSSQQLSKSLDFALKDFSPDDKVNEHWMDPTKEVQIDIPLDIAPEPYIVFIIFDLHLKKYEYGGRWEKVAWEIPIKYKGIPFLLSHRKFGFRILTTPACSECKETAIEAVKAINKAIPIAEKLIEPYIKSRIDKGYITLPNDYWILKSRYDYFREMAESSFRKAEKYKTSESYGEVFKHTKKASNYVITMIDAYFSLIEHALVLLKPFVRPEVIESNLSSYIGLNWGKKYKVIFDINADQKAKEHYDNLQNIKERYRNTLAHGNFQKKGSSMYVQMQNLGAIPMLLTKSKGTLHFSFNRFGEIDFSFYGIDETVYRYICDTFDGFDSFLKKGATKYGMQYLESGLSVSFNNNSRQMYISAMKSDKEFKEFIEYESYMYDRAVNMDW